MRPIVGVCAGGVLLVDLVCGGTTARDMPLAVWAETKHGRVHRETMRLYEECAGVCARVHAPSSPLNA
jgi:hypothetical protein